MNALFEKDFVMLFRNEQINTPICLLQKLNDEYALMVSMLADLRSKEELKE